MMRKWITGLALVALAGCGGDDPQGLAPAQTVQAVVTVDWPLAREPGFVDATYSVKSFDFDTTTLAAGAIPPIGVTEARFMVRCGPSHPAAYVFQFRGHFTQYEGLPIGPDDEILCGMWEAISFPDCENPTHTTEPQDGSVPSWQCEPPPE